MKWNKSVAIIYIALMIVLTACNISKPEDKQNKDLEVYGMSSALGSAGNDLDKTKFSYTIPITNNSDEDIYIEWMEPVLGDKVSNRVLSSDLRINVQNKVIPEESLEIAGEIILDTKGLTKQQITELEPFITEIVIDCQKVIELNWQK